jgi:hypothetical protein
MLVPADWQQRALPTVYDNIFPMGCWCRSLLSWQWALLAISWYHNFMDFIRFLFKVTTRFTRD